LKREGFADAIAGFLWREIFSRPALDSDSPFEFKSMKVTQGNFDWRAVAQRLLLLACLSLIAITAVAQATHYHANDLSSNDSSCAICQVAHAPVAVGSLVFVAIVLAVTCFVILVPRPAPTVVFQDFFLFSRPPPKV
jgi:hypothetical protein